MIVEHHKAIDPNVLSRLRDFPEVSYAMTVIQTVDGEVYVANETHLFGKVYEADEERAMDLISAMYVCGKSFDESRVNTGRAASGETEHKNRQFTEP